MSRELTSAEVAEMVRSLQERLAAMLGRVRGKDDINTREELGKLIVMVVEVLALAAEANTVARSAKSSASMATMLSMP